MDTSKTIFGKPRTGPSLAHFHPVGHVSIDDNDPYLPVGAIDKVDGIYWITTLYVSSVLQGIGLGSAAMETVERTILTEIGAKTAGLDVLARETAMEIKEERKRGGELPQVC